jgi:AraC-like DNA-binding protein
MEIDNQYEFDDGDFSIEYRVVSAYINGHLGDSAMHISQIAKVVSLTIGKLEKIFKHFEGETVVHAIRKRRLEKSAGLLRSTNMPINKIAFLCGFTDMPYFNRMFKKHFGMTPKALRKKDKILPKKDNLLQKKDYLL